MQKISIFLAVTILGYIGWYIGERFGIMIAFTLSSIGLVSMVIVYAYPYYDIFDM